MEADTQPVLESRLEALVDYGEPQVRELCHQRGLDWDAMTESERQALVDTWLHETHSEA